MANALIQKADHEDRLLKVGMNKIGIVKFGVPENIEDEDKKFFCIATESLNSCHGVAIITSTAAALGHFAPGYPGFPPGEFFATYLTQLLIDAVTNDQNKKYFVNEAIKGVLVVGFEMVETQDGEIKQQVLPYQVSTIAKKLRDDFDLDPKVVEYGPVKKSDPTDSRPDRGKVYIEGFASGQVPTMWVEENQVPLTLSKRE